MANGHGGARPGAGRKRRDTVTLQATRRDVVLHVIDDDAWTKLVRKWLALAEETPSVLYPLLPYLLGSAKAADASPGGDVLTVRIVTVDDRDRRPEIRVLDTTAG